MTPEEVANRIANDYLPVGTIRTAEFLAIQKDIAAALRAYGDVRAAEERSRAASTASLVFVNDPYALHPDIAFDDLNESARTAAHSIAQIIALLIANAE